MVRRRFLQSLAAAAGAASLSPAEQTGVKLGFDTYSLRAFHWKVPQLIEYAASQKLDTIQITSLDDYQSLDAAYLAKVKDQAARAHLMLEAGTGCICPSSHAFSQNGPPARDRVLQGLRVAKAIGAVTMRCYLGTSADRLGPLPIEAHIENTVRVFRSVRTEALDLGVRIAIENHDGDMQAWETKTLIEEAGKDFVGSCLDTGNPIWVVEDPLVSLEVLAPYVITTHVRDSVVFEHPRGAAGQWVVLGDGSVDFTRFTERFRAARPGVAMQLEIITGRPPRVLPYLEADFWKAFPKARAGEFARFVALAKSGHPYMGAMVIEDVPGEHPPAILGEALKEQQRLDLERSLEFARRKLNVGVNWRA